MIDLLKSRNKIIINSDIDGVLSGLILQHYLNCEVVGFSNSNDKIWTTTPFTENEKDFVFIDMFVARKDLACIDQHIVAVNEQHNNIIQQNKLKINPNTVRGRYFYPSNSYRLKYPFGTVHFIIAFLEKEGIRLDFNLFSQESELQAIDFLLRADDAFHTTKVKYKENAKDWWKWLIKYSNSGNITTKFSNYISDFKGNSSELKSKVERKIFTFGCDKPDGNFSNILNDEKKLKKNFVDYVNYVAKTINLPTLTILDNWKIYEGEPKRINLKKAKFDSFIEKSQEKLFSYAFVKSFGKADSLSYTILYSKKQK